MKSFAPGDVVAGRYELRRPLGHGGICNVFEALHKHTGRLVALKCLNEDYASRADARERLRREALALGAVRHPHVVDVLDADEDRSQPFLVTEVLHGKSLEALLVARQKLPPEDVVTVGAQLASALSAVHAAGMVHRDLKPSNVFIVSLPTGDQHAKLLDFGIARLPETRPDTPRLTASDAVIGTFEYMAPEQLLGRPTDERTDVFGLGMILFECVSGDVPVQGSYETLIRHLSTGQRVTLRERAPMAPSALCAVVDRCTERSPARRYATAAEALTALQRTGLGRPMQLLDAAARDDAPTTQRAASGAFDAIDANAPQNRRVHARVPYLTPARLACNDEVLDGRVEDLSAGGVLVIVPRPLAVGAKVTLRMALPTTGAVVSTDATVCWARARPGPGNVAALGLRFVSPPQSLVDAVQTLLAHAAR